MKTEYKLLTSRYAEHLLDELNDHGAQGWSIAMYNQEYGVTKVILERKVDDNDN